MILKELTQVVLKFRNDRNWGKYHNPKDIAISLSLEAAEVLEHFKWKNEEELIKYLNKNKKAISHELSDVLHNVILLASELELDLEKAFKEKMKLNEKKYPIPKRK